MIAPSFPDQQSLLRRLVELEGDVRYQELAAEDEPEFVVERGEIPFLLSAPHGAVHCRNGEIKYEDEFTAAMARMAARLTGAHVIYARRRSLTDPNWYPDVPYKARIMQLIEDENIRFVLDFHGASAKRTFGIGIGTLHGRSCPGAMSLILSTLAEYGFSESGQTRLERLDVDQTFAAVGSPEQETVTRFVWEQLQIPVVQLEFNASLRTVHEKEDSSYLIRRLGEPFIGQPAHITRTMKGVVSLIGALNESFC
jgi:hypothetical protein